jgi:serine O-acetyltransferase
MNLLRAVVSDAVELARSMQRQDRKGENAAPGTRDILRAALTQDGFKVLALTRMRERVRKTTLLGANHLLRLTTSVLYSIEIGSEVELGEGVNFAHTLGIVIGGTSKIGARVTFFGNNTIGTAKNNGYPTIEDDVIIGAGARILGPIRVGRGAVIGANAVVLEDVPAGAVVVGIPARVVGSAD